MSELSELYQAVHPRSQQEASQFSCVGECEPHCEGLNPLCGDKLTLYLQLEDQAVKDISFVGEGCAIWKGLGQHDDAGLEGQEQTGSRRTLDEFHRMVTGQLDEEESEPTGPLKDLCRRARVSSPLKCATLSWHTMHAALERTGKSVD